MRHILRLARKMGVPHSTADPMRGLNPQQLEAVMHTEGPLLVLAGAGSGKTSVIVEKIAHLINSVRMPARRIAAITFTNKSAREMRERVAKRIKEEDAKELTLCTFHALGLKILQMDGHRIGLRRGFSIFDSDDSAAQFKDLLPRGTKGDEIARMHSLVSNVKNIGLSPEQAADIAQSVREKEVASLYKEYQARLTAFNAVDFDDLIRLPVQLLETDAEALAVWRERIGYLLVDECQDTNDSQYRLLKALAGERGLFTAVGDDDQSIYAWRGANPENLLSLGSDYPSLRIVKLEQNYRCSNRILRAANEVIANNPHEHLKRLWSDRSDGERIRVWECTDSVEEAERVAAQIALLVHQYELPYSEFAVLFRGNHQSRPLEKALQIQRIPYHLNGGTAFLDRAEVKDVMAWLRVISNPDDDAAFLRAIASPKRDVGAASLTKLAALASHAGVSMARAINDPSLLRVLTPRAANGLDQFASIISSLRARSHAVSAGDLVRELLVSSGMETNFRSLAKNEADFNRRKANATELAEWFDDSRSVSVGDLNAQLALLSNADRGEPGNQVRLMSMHASKGLEFSAVFVVGCNDGVLPHETSLDEGSLDEERRLFYVALTRCKQHLYLSYSKRTSRFGSTVSLEPSRFLDELPLQEIEREGADPALDAARKKEHATAAIDAIFAALK